MRVAMSALGWFHAFNLDQRSQKRDAIAQLLTRYPKFKAVEYGVTSEKVSLFVLHSVGFTIIRGN